MRRAARTDGNHVTIRQAFEAVGCMVADASHVGNGFPDLIVAIPPFNVMIEVKDSAQPRRFRKLTNAQKIFHKGWSNPIHVVETVDQALLIVDHYRSKKWVSSP